MTIDEYAAWCYALGGVGATSTADDYFNAFGRHERILNRVPPELEQYHSVRMEIMARMAVFLLQEQEGDDDPPVAPDTLSLIYAFEAIVDDLHPSTRAALKEAGCAY